ncbi:MAG: GlxA family transcriptional regulator [Bauldia sp.]
MNDRMFAENDVYRQATAISEVGIVVYPDAQLSAIHGWTDLFTLAAWTVAQHGTGRNAIRVTHWRASADGGGVACVYDSMPGPPHSPSIILMPSCLGHPPGPDVVTGFAEWLKTRHAEGATIASVCLGAFLLAEAGLLAGRRATTHWRFGHVMASRFPDVEIDVDRLIVDDGDIITAGGLLAWVDLGLLIVARLLGPAIAVETSRYLLFDATGREQRHYSAFLPSREHGDERILLVQHWLDTTYRDPATIEAMASRAGMTERTFLRRFQKATGMTPRAYHQRIRIDHAREMLEFSNAAVKSVAWDVGYADLTAFSRVFRRITGLPPAEYRRRFTSRGFPAQERPQLASD